jgi:hypothetical protein
MPFKNKFVFQKRSAQFPSFYFHLGASNFAGQNWPQATEMEADFFFVLSRSVELVDTFDLQVENFFGMVPQCGELNPHSTDDIRTSVGKFFRDKFGLGTFYRRPPQGTPH